MTLSGTNNINGTGNNLDNVLNGNDSNNTLNGGAGNDTLQGMGGNDTLMGGNGNDILRGGVGDDHIYGGAGNDRIVGNAGHDTLSGGAGNDTFVFTTTSDSTSANPDIITDFQRGSDKIDLSQTSIHDGDWHYSYDATNNIGSLTATDSFEVKLAGVHGLDAHDVIC